MLGLSGVAEQAFGRTPSAPRSEDRFGTLYWKEFGNQKRKFQLATMTPWQRVRFRLAYWGFLPSRPGSKDRNRKAFELGQEAARKAAENQGFCLANELYLELLG